MVRAAILNQSDELPKNFILEDAIPEIKRHRIATLCYDGAILCGIPKESPAMQELHHLYLFHLMHCTQQQCAIRSLVACFEKNQIDYMLLKGAALHRIYPKPEYRTMGDIDILIRTEQYENIRPLMNSLGYTEGVESDHELHWESNEILVELHKRLIPSYNKDFYAYYGDGWDFAQKKESEYQYTMSDEDTFLYLFSHFSKHYRDKGIGYQHLIDLWVYRLAKQKLNENYIISELKKLNLDIFYKNVLRTLDVMFSGGEPDEITDLISNTIFSSGAYGTLEASRLSSALKKSKLTGRSKDVKFISTIEVMFPSAKSLEGVYPILKRFPVFLPIIWAVRGFKKLIFHRDRIENVFNDIQSMNPDDINNYKINQNAVGLDYHFR